MTNVAVPVDRPQSYGVVRISVIVGFSNTSTTIGIDVDEHWPSVYSTFNDSINLIGLFAKSIRDKYKQHQ
jgi:hypothetical protein